MVAISHAHRFVFIKTHKTASTTVDMFLEPFCAPAGHVPERYCDALETEHGIIGARGPKLDGQFWRAHMGAPKIRTGLADGQFDAYTKLTTIRNPFTRAVSKFLFRRRYQNLPPLTDLSEIRRAFCAFLMGDNYRSDYFKVHVKHRYIVDIALRFEHLKTDVMAACARLGLDPAQSQLGHENDNRAASTARPTADYYADPATIARVHEIDAWMFDHHGYADRPMEAA
jgi:hypothetical protein